jgi:glycosyltransferase involved in cell wall biosynthesis
MKRVLFIAYPFPPEGGASVKRTLKFIRYLPELGWEPIVLTVKNGNHRDHDPSLLNMIDKNVRVYRAFTPETLLKGDGQRKEKVVGVDQQKEKVSRTRGTVKKMWRAAYHLIGEYVGIPDAHILWLPHAFLKGIQIIFKYKCEVIYATGPTFTDHIIGLLLKKATGRSLVVDFRDAWMANPSCRSNNKLKRKVEGLLEKKVILESDVVVSTTSGMSDDFRGRYPQTNVEKFITITNGFDPEDFAFAPQKPMEKFKFRIVHTGILGLERSPKFFLQALRKLIDELPGLEGDIEVIFVGKNLKFDDNKNIEDYINELDLWKVVQIKGFISRAESLVYQQSADLLLLVIGIVPEDFLQTYGLSGKAFDYAISGKPVLALAQDGATAEFVRKTGIGVVVQPDNVEMIKNSLKKIYLAFKSRGLIVKRNEEQMQKYNLRFLTGELARHFDSCPFPRRERRDEGALAKV